MLALILLFQKKWKLELSTMEEKSSFRAGYIHDFTTNERARNVFTSCLGRWPGVSSSNSWESLMVDGEGGTRRLAVVVEGQVMRKFQLALVTEHGRLLQRRRQRESTESQSF